LFVVTDSTEDKIHASIITLANDNRCNHLIVARQIRQMPLICIRRQQPMAKATSPTRAPRGTKILAKAFLSAADEIPEPQRAEVVKAALALIRDELKVTREKAALTRAKAKTKTGKAPATPSRKVAGVAMTPAKAVKKTASVAAKSPAKRARKQVTRIAEPTTPETSVET
jgi:hypothetical protein